jgi:hypothetical protein
MGRWILGGIACIAAGGWMLYDHFKGLPAFDQLTPLTGEVVSAEKETKKRRRSQSHYLAVQIHSQPTAYYSERFPDFDRIATTLKPGDKVTAWVDVGRNNYIWQLDKGADRIVSFQQVAEAQAGHTRNNALMGGAFLLFGIGTVVVMAIRAAKGPSHGATEQEGEPPPSPDPAAGR